MFFKILWTKIVKGPYIFPHTLGGCTPNGSPQCQLYKVIGIKEDCLQNLRGNSKRLAILVTKCEKQLCAILESQGTVISL